jgi:glyoxylase-like metal-dependent hydrolase (beta-lactamase superfamily II)
MKLHIIDTGRFKLDGGAMFGVVPKSLWSRTNPADDNNMCTWAMRCMLIEDGDQLILIDNGIGNKQDAKFFKHYYLHGDGSLDGSLKKAGFSTDDITDMFLTHLHFDHCGGGVDWQDKSESKLDVHFKNAKYWSNKDHWKGDILYANGHTDKQMIPKIKYKDKTIVFAADLLPSVGHIPLPYVMGYDTRPLLTLDEKAQFLKDAADNEWIIFLEHDAQNECCTVKHTEKGVRLDRTFSLSEVL